MAFLAFNESESRKLLGDQKPPTIGRKPVDVEELQKQILEKSLAKLEEKKIDQTYEDYHNTLAKQEIEVDRRHEIEKRVIAKELNEYRLTVQKKQYRREFDLEDTKPDAATDRFLAPCDSFNKQTLKCKSGVMNMVERDYERQQGKSSLRLREALEKQIAEKNWQKRDKDEADKEYVKDLMSRNVIYNQCIDIERQAKKLEQEYVKDCNLAIVAEKKKKDTSDKRREDADRMAHIYNCLTSDFFLETPNALQSALNAGQTNAIYFKGGSEEQLRDLQIIRQQQIEEKQNVKEEEVAKDLYYQQIDQSIAQQLNQNDRQLKLVKIDEERRIRNENKLMAIEKAVADKECKVDSRKWY